MAAKKTAPKENKTAQKVKADGGLTVDLGEHGTIFVSADVFDDLEFFEEYSAIQNGDLPRLPAFIRTIFGDDYDRVKDYLRDENGRVSIARMGEFMTEIFPNS